MSTQDLIETVCKKCHLWQKGCPFDYGDSLTKIPCEALVQLVRLDILTKGLQEKNMTERDFLEMLEKSPDGFAKSWGYAMYGAFKAVESMLKMRERGSG